MGIDMAGRTETQSANDFSERLNKMCSLSQQEAIIHELDNAAYYVERNANAKILFHALTIKIYHIISNKSVILMNWGIRLVPAFKVNKIFDLALSL